MKEFFEYFSHEQIIKLLCKYRLKYAKQRHKIHLLRDVSLHKKTLDDFHSKCICPPELSSIMPSRRTWLRLNEDERKFCKSSTDVAIESLRRTILTIHIKVKAGSISAPEWYLNLMEFIKKIQERINGINDDKIQTPIICAIKKENIKDCKKFRPIAQYKLDDRIIIGQTARYLTAIFDEQLLHCCYAFRATIKGKKVKTHHDCVDEILEYRRKVQSKNIWVTECDISKFFDCINHRVVTQKFEDFVNKAKEGNKQVDEKARIIFNQYLISYAFNTDVYPKNKSGYFLEKGFKDGSFEWVETELKKNFYPDGMDKERIGIPQGGALSCLMANLIMHEADEKVLCTNHQQNICYLRFCDDMIILANCKEDCNIALNAYMQEIKKVFLIAHAPAEISFYNKDFFNKRKSKAPFQWGSKKNHNHIPWISFVGYQIRYDGCVRARKKSLKKETQKQKTEAEAVLRAIHAHDKENLNAHSRKSLKQQVHALESRLISMSVGRHKIYNYKTTSPVFCWTNGFKKISNHSVCKAQLRLLDRNRLRQLYRVKQELKELNKVSENPDILIPLEKYFGAPFSYYGFLNRQFKPKGKIDK